MKSEKINASSTNSVELASGQEPNLGSANSPSSSSAAPEAGGGAAAKPLEAKRALLLEEKVLLLFTQKSDILTAFELALAINKKYGLFDPVILRSVAPLITDEDDITKNLDDIYYAYMPNCDGGHSSYLTINFSDEQLQVAHLIAIEELEPKDVGDDFTYPAVDGGSGCHSDMAGAEAAKPSDEDSL
jgi:hypothetical protein